jgi:hypothetical protein
MEEARDASVMADEDHEHIGGRASRAMRCVANECKRGRAV